MLNFTKHTRRFCAQAGSDAAPPQADSRADQTASKRPGKGGSAETDQRENAVPDSTLNSTVEPLVLSRDEHPVSRKNISRGALDVLYDLNRAGFEAYLVGGGVRDLLAGLQPKDFDIATNATPEEVEAVFRRCRLIGRRFRLAHVRMGPEVLEVATFRASPGQETEAAPGGDAAHALDDAGRILRDNVYGTLEDDAFRRDFTVNALYYRVTDYAIVDYTGGMADVVSKLIRLIGDPETRYREDPVRMLRAVRIANKLGYSIERATANPIRGLAHLIADVPAARLFDEVLKLFLNEHAEQNYNDLLRYGLFQAMFPQSVAGLGMDGAEVVIRGALRGTAQRVADGRPVTPAFLYAALLWPAVRANLETASDADDDEGMPTGKSFAQGIAENSSDIVSEQVERVAIPRRFSTPMREIWALQPRFEQRRGKRPIRLLGHPRFRAAYDFLLLRADAGEVDQSLAQWWTEFQEEHPDEVHSQRRQHADDGGDASEGRSGGRRRSRGGRGRRNRGGRSGQDQAS